MKFGLKDNELKNIVKAIKGFKQIEKAVIFGSRARGDYKRTSDIDIAIYSKQITSTELNLLRDQLSELDVIYKIDVVDFYGLRKEGLIKNIEDEGEEIFRSDF
ncbi:MAG: nucleotidyltransferase domain-containing protein [Halanaerobiales bacterium]|nr:nucleotidyltransferase domain-containing protein [Halanaerobiales bacterium]